MRSRNHVTANASISAFGGSPQLTRGRAGRFDRPQGGGPFGVKTGKAQCEYMFSALPLIADISRRFSHSMISSPTQFTVEARYLSVIRVTVAARVLRHSGRISRRIVRAGLDWEDTMTSNTQSKDNRIVTDEELDGVSGGVRTNGDNPFVQVAMLATKEAFYKGMWYSSVGW